MPGVAQQRHDPLAQQREVLGDHDPHGSSARTWCPCPAGLVTDSAPVERLDAVAQPGQPAAVADPRRPRPLSDDLDDERVAVLRPRARAPARRRACFAALVSASAATKYAAVSTTGGGRSPISASTVTGIAERRREPLERGGEAAVGEHRRGDPAREVAQLGDRRAGLLARLADQLGQLGLVVEPRLGAAEVHAERDEPRLRAVVQVALDPPQLGGLHVDRAAPRAGQLVDALLELLLARPGAGGRRARARRARRGAPSSGQTGQKSPPPDSAQIATSGSRASERGRLARGRAAPGTGRAAPPRATEDHHVDAGGDGEPEPHPAGPEVAGAGERPQQR